MPTCEKCKSCFPNWVEIDGRKRNLHTRRFCLACSPFGAHNRRDLTRSDWESKTCPICDQRKPLADFYVKLSEGGRPSGYCKKCMKQKDLEDTRRFKKHCVEYKGGSCEICGYNRCLAALEFHHRDPAKKKFGLGSQNIKRLTAEILKELDKCDLLCANCHAEEHVKKDDISELNCALVAKKEKAPVS